ncbi:MAG: twin-arginine translocase subunit TatC [Verrucomicrobia bacterium]|nr:twin-arginine translocase subunit TatC [Verrucomicrobiota bacterium]
MATDPDEVRTDVEDEDGGGPVKSFLEHLEDFRWTLIKIVVSIAVAMLLCLIAGNYVVGVIKRPLDKAKIRYPGTNQVVTLLLGTNRLGVFQLDANQQAAFQFGTNRFVALQLAPITIGSNQVLGIRMDTNNDAAETAQKLKIDLNTLSPAGGFFVAFQVAFYGGLALASPFIFYFIANFVFPALKMKEKKYVNRGLLVAVPLFMVGVTFCYFILMPIALAASQLYSNWLGFSANIWRAEEYISFVCKFLLGMGLGFEMPVVILVLVKIGILNYSILSKGRRYMIVVNLILGALLTTPEVLTQVIMFIPLQALYEISIWIAWYWERQERKRQEAEANAVP